MSEIISPLPGLKELLMGPTGTGKTTSIRKWIEAGIEVRAIFTEPSFEVVGDIPCEAGFHYRYIPSSTQSFSVIADTLKKINTFDFKALSGMTDISKKDYKDMITVAEACNSFTCDRCHKNFGGADTWGTNVVFVLDSLSGLSNMSMRLVVGAKPAKGQQDWGVAMDNVKGFIERCCAIHCHFLLIAHVEKETDETTGVQHVTLSTLGRKLAPQLVLNFSDVILAKRDGAAFTWSTAAANTDLKARNLPWQDRIAPEVAPLLESWKSRGGIIEVPSI